MCARIYLRKVLGYISQKDIYRHKTRLNGEWGQSCSYFVYVCCCHFDCAARPFPEAEEQGCLEPFHSDKVDQGVEEAVGGLEQVGRDGENPLRVRGETEELARVVQVVEEAVDGVRKTGEEEDEDDPEDGHCAS